MKVLVLYENSREMPAAFNLARNLEKIGAMLANATVVDNGASLRVNAGPQWSVEATASPFESLPKPKPKRPPLPRGGRELIFDDEE